MSLRPRTVRRLLILLAAVLVLVGTAAAFYYKNDRATRGKLLAARDAGMTAFKSGDYRSALDNLKIYVARDIGKKDIDALYAYGVSRARIEEPSGKNILEGITVFKTIVQLDPTHADSKHQLLDLYARAGYTADAIELADQLLTQRPDDRAALSAKCAALERTRKYDAALKISQKLNELQPTDLDQQFTTYRLMINLKRPPEELLARAQKMQAEHLDDPRFAMLLAMAYANAADPTSGKEWLRRAATQPAPDAIYVRHMVRILDSLKLYKDAQDLLERASAEHPDPGITKILLQRLWESGRYSDVLERTKSLDPASPDSDADELAYRALSLYETNRTNDAKQIIAALGQRGDDIEANAWSTALATRLDNAADPRSALYQYQLALSRAPDNAVIRCLVGEAYARLGETELAVGAWRRAAELSPSWSRPRMLAARALATSNRLGEAIKEAQLAYTASPSSECAILLTSIASKALEQGVLDSGAEPDLLANITQIQKQQPGEPETLPAYVNLLARAGRRDEAIKAARVVLDNPQKYQQATILRLLAASRTNKLGLDDEFQKLAATSGEKQDTPRLALARATDLAMSGKADEGMALLQSRVKAAAATTQPVQWQLVLTQYKEITHDPDVASAWVALGDANPDDLAVQTAILRTGTSVRADRDFIARTIDRLKAITGPEGQTWKIERARWLIGSGSTKDAADAVNTLSEIVRVSPTLTEARLLLADAHAAVGNTPAAIKELQAAADQEPTNDRILLALARQLQDQGRFGDARTYLDRAAQIPDLSADSRWRVAGLIAAQGDAARGITILESAGAKLDPAGQLLLADLYRRQRRFTDAEAIYSKLLAAKPLTIDILRAAADYYASRHQPSQADHIIARVAELPNLQPGTAELYQAEFAERYKGGDAAKNLYQGAILAGPTNAIAWRQWTAFHLRRGEFDQAAQAAAEGLKSLPGDAGLTTMRSVAISADQLVAQKGPLQSTVERLAAVSSGDPAATEFFTSGSDDPTSQPIAASAVPARIKDFASRYPGSLPMQIALMQSLHAQHQVDEAAKVAERTMEMFPSDVASAHAAATLYCDAGKWDLAAAAIARWRQRTLDDPMAADVMLAKVQLGKGDSTAALKTLSPYVAPITAAPGENLLGTDVLARAYAATGDEVTAKKLLQPLLEKVWGRSIWIALAGNDLKDSATATQWLKEVAPRVDADSPEQMTELASGYYQLGVRLHDASALERAAAILDPIVQRDSPPVPALLLRASVADRAGDAQTAETFYRRGLSLQADQPEAMNNLAYLILTRNGDLAEAGKLASRAVQLSPQEASFYDTLARIQLKQGQRDVALGSFEQALKLDPNNLDALIGMAGALRDAGKGKTAAALLEQIDTLVKDKSTTLSPELQRELESLRSTVKASL